MESQVVVALEKTLIMVEPYLKMATLNDEQAARIGRELFSNLKQAKSVPDVVERISQAK